MEEKRNSTVKHSRRSDTGASSGSHLRNAQAAYRKTQGQASPSKKRAAPAAAGKTGWIPNFWVSKTPRKKKTTYESPPVLIRAIPMTRLRTGEGRHATSSVRKRKRLDVPDVPGASISLPVLQGLLDWRFFSLCLVIGLVVILYLMWTSPYLVVEQATVRGLKRIMSQDVNAVLDISGMPSFALDPAAMQKTLVEQFPEFSAADVIIEFPDTVAISVTERVPALVWNQGGRTDLIDQEGVAFPLRQNDVELDLPIVEASGMLMGLIPTPVPTDTEQTEASRFRLFGKPEEIELLEQARQVLTPEAVQSILLLSEFAPQGLPLIYRDDHGFSWQDSGGWYVYFGDATDIQMKLTIYQSILRMLDEKGVRPELVSVEWVHAPYYRLER
jgi:hypothetical protein